MKMKLSPYFSARLKEVKTKSLFTDRFRSLADGYFSKLWYSFFNYTLLSLRSKNNKKNPIVLKFDVWEESSLDVAKIRHLPFMIKKIFDPKEIFFLDIDKDLLKLAKKNIKVFGFNKTFLSNGTIADMPFDNESFDFIIDFSTIDHLDNNETGRTIGEIHRVLKRGGSVIIYHLNSDYRDIEEWDKLYKEDRYPSFPRKLDDIIHLMKEEFEIEDYGYCMPFFADSSKLVYYRIIYNKIHNFLPSRLLFSFSNSPKLNLFFYVIAKKI